MLASALCRLATLLVDEAPDTVGAAQRAVRSVMAGLKTAAPAETDGEISPLAQWVQRVSSLDKEISKQQRCASQAWRPLVMGVCQVAGGRDAGPCVQDAGLDGAGLLAARGS